MTSWPGSTSATPRSTVSRPRGPRVDISANEVWFVTGSQHLYGPETLATVAEHSAAIAAALDAAPGIPVKVVVKPVLTGADEIRRLCQEANASDACIGLVTWMHTFSPAKMWIAGLGGLQKPFLHLHTQFNDEIPWATIDMDFMNLNQAAHGDREFGFLAARLRLERTVVVGHWADTSVQDRIGVWARAASARKDWLGGRIARVRRQHARGRGHRGRQVRGAAAARLQRQLVRRRRPGCPGRRDVRLRRRPAHRGLLRRVRRGPRAGSGRRRTARCAMGRGSSWDCARSSATARSSRLPTPSRTSMGCASCRGSLSSG